MREHADGSAGALSFGAVAAAYEHGRPSYPPRAVDWLLPRGARRVADVGAGTGKLTRVLRERGLDVVAVEPSAGMREQFRVATPGVPALGGAFERLPLADSSVDAVLAAQAWHWADPGLALPEAARVLRPGGRLGLLWNIRDETVDWVARLGRIMRSRGAAPAEYTPALGPPFEPPERMTARWANHLTRDALLDLVSSRSYVIALPPPERAEILEQVRRLLDSHPALAGSARVALPYVTTGTRARLGRRPAA